MGAGCSWQEAPGQAPPEHVAEHPKRRQAPGRWPRARCHLPKLPGLQKQCEGRGLVPRPPPCWEARASDTPTPMAPSHRGFSPGAGRAGCPCPAPCSTGGRRGRTGALQHGGDRGRANPCSNGDRARASPRVPGLVLPTQPRESPGEGQKGARAWGQLPGSDTSSHHPPRLARPRATRQRGLCPRRRGGSRAGLTCTRQ